MKRLFISIMVAISLFSCDNKNIGATDKKSSNENVLNTEYKLDNDDKKASYAFGTGLAESISSLSNTLIDSDKIDLKELENGIKDYLKSKKEIRESYAIGQQVGQQIENILSQQELTMLDKQLILKGLIDVMGNKTLLMPRENSISFLDDYAKKHHEKIAAKNLDESNKIMNEKKSVEGVKSTNSGLLYLVNKEGNGTEKPNNNSLVRVKYIGKILSSGKVFDSTYKNPKNKDGVYIPLNQVIPGWAEGLKLMSKGAKYTFYIPSKLAYDKMGAPGGVIGPNKALEFEVELIDFVENKLGEKKQ